MSSAASLGNLLNLQSDLNYYTMQLTFWSAKYEANAEKLEKQTSYESKFESAFESAIDNDRDISTSFGGKTIKVKANNTDQALADRYAHAKVSKYDESLSLELAELDMDYDTQKTMYEALVTMLQAEKDSAKQSTATAMQDTHLLQS